MVAGLEVVIRLGLINAESMRGWQMMRVSMEILGDAKPGRQIPARIFIGRQAPCKNYRQSITARVGRREPKPAVYLDNRDTTNPPIESPWRPPHHRNFERFIGPFFASFHPDRSSREIAHHSSSACANTSTQRQRRRKGTTPLHKLSSISHTCARREPM